MLDSLKHIYLTTPEQNKTPVIIIYLLQKGGKEIKRQTKSEKKAKQGESVCYKGIETPIQ